MNQANDFNCINQFLSLNDYNDKSHYDVILVLGSALPGTAYHGYKLFLENKADYFIISGGRGHTTTSLIDKLSPFITINHPSMISEAEVLKDYLEDIFGYDERIILETKSRHCGENIALSMSLLQSLKIPVNNVLLIHDPLMQRRIDATACKQYPHIHFSNFAYFTPHVIEEPYQLSLKYNDWAQWDFRTYVHLLLGEMKRLSPDSSGYGSQGMNYINDVHMPNDVIKSYERIKKSYGQMMRK